MTTTMNLLSTLQLRLLLEYAWKRCGATEEELKEYLTRFQAMTSQQAFDLINAWSELPETRLSAPPVVVPEWTATVTPPATPPAPLAPMTEARRILAKYSSTCTICNQTITVGQWIWYLKGQKATHDWCGKPGTPPVAAPVTSPRDYQCRTCMATFPTMLEREEHFQAYHAAPLARFSCAKCGAMFTTNDLCDRHTQTAHPLPAAYPIPDKGYYAVEVPVNGVMTMRFYRVTQRRPPYDKHFTFARQSGENWVAIDASERKLAAAIICAAPVLAMEAYGKLLGHCGCCGRALTDPESRARGIGPECIKMYPDRQ
jgi:Family of unknown function (DUF6011)